MFNLTIDESASPVSRETVERTAYSLGVSSFTFTPLPYNELSKKLGYKASLLMLCLSKNPNVSLPALKGTVELISTLTEYPAFKVNSLTTSNNAYPVFTLETLAANSIFSNDLEFSTNISHCFRISPELKVPKISLGLNARGSYELDLSLELVIIKELIEYSVAKVIVEFDGPMHLNSDNVRNDKLRDSYVQSQGATVFRIQSVNTHDLTKIQQTEKSHEQLMAHIGNIKEHFRRRLFEFLKTFHNS
ncbi:endonuclease domain-containing protein [Enterobacter roggenkampii]|uniref:DUF559 domain-containing protein n=1 Tax=Enterobacter roggenkampii TaxID=1812935 RepID=UPI0020029B5E|nr:DUF559 domain-containing protein [Enterobacter roggenkampii]MCK7071094.1 endonuclease domain-containing protein [Enterobacter roggenkampii]MCK7092415.1 endonuclease domain-containing protein [Enterobacter roggenkampii]